MMAASGVNALRTYTPPPGWLLDAAQRHGLRVAAEIREPRGQGVEHFRGRHPRPGDRLMEACQVQVDAVITDNPDEFPRELTRSL